MKKIRIGIVGCGAVVRRHHLPVLLNHPKAAIAALCDQNPAAAQQIKSKYGLSAPVYTNDEEMFGSQGIDVIDICTPGETHYQLAKQALEAGKHVLLEKPPVMRADDARKLDLAAQERGLKIGTIFNNRHRAVLTNLREKIESGIVGKIVKIHVLHHANLVYGDSSWLWHEKQSKYLVYEFGIHMIDFVTSILGEHESVLQVIPYYQDSIKHTTEIQVSVRYKSGGMANFIISQDSTRHSTYKTVIDVYGTGMDAHVRFFPPLVRLSAGLEHPLNLLKSEIKSFSNLLWLLGRKKWGEYQNRGHFVVLNQYIDWITEDKAYPLTLGNVLPTLRLLDDISDRIPSYQ